MAQQQTVRPARVAQQPLKVRSPQALWVNDYERSAGAFEIQDAVQRFMAVNEPYERAEKQAVLKRLGASVMDMHYQSQVTAGPILDAYLAEKLQRSEMGCWVITGTGHHTAEGHQAKGGVLFQTVEDYLIHYGYSYNIGIDGQARSGAFFVKKTRA